MAKRQLELEKRRMAEIARLRMENRQLREKQAAAAANLSSGGSSVGGNGSSTPPGSPTPSASRSAQQIGEGADTTGSAGDGDDIRTPRRSSATNGVIGRRQIEAYTSRHFEWEKQRAAKLLTARHAKQRREEEQEMHACKQFVVKKRGRKGDSGSGGGGNGAACTATGGSIEGRLLAWAEAKQQRRLTKKKELQAAEKKAFEGQKAILYKNCRAKAADAAASGVSGGGGKWDQSRHAPRAHTPLL